MRQRWCALLCAAVWALASSAASPQEAPAERFPVLVLDRDRLFEETGVSSQVTAEIGERRQALFEENKRIEAELVAEELALTERRAELSPEEFRPLADAFDAKVQALRAEQDAKEQALQQLLDQEFQNFSRRILPLLAQIAQERRALAVIDMRAVIVSAGAIDITDEAISRVAALLAEEGADVEDAPPTSDAPAAEDRP